jgi:hypothetical protein
MGFTDRFKGKVVIPFSALQALGCSAPGSSNSTFALSGGQIAGGQFFGSAGNFNDTTEDLLQFYTLPGNMLDAPGRGLIITAWGTFANNAQVKTARLYFGASLIATVTNSANSSIIPWWAQIQFGKSAANQQKRNHGRAVPRRSSNPHSGLN